MLCICYKHTEVDLWEKREGSHLLNNVVTGDKKGGTDVMTLRSEVNPKGLSAFFTKMCSWHSVRQFHWRWLQYKIPFQVIQKTSTNLIKNIKSKLEFIFIQN